MSDGVSRDCECRDCTQKVIAKQAVRIGALERALAESVKDNEDMADLYDISRESVAAMGEARVCTSRVLKAEQEAHAKTKQLLADGLMERDEWNSHHGREKKAHAATKAERDALRLALRSVGAECDEVTAPYKLTDILAMIKFRDGVRELVALDTDDPTDEFLFERIRDMEDKENLMCKLTQERDKLTVCARALQEKKNLLLIALTRIRDLEARHTISYDRTHAWVLLAGEVREIANQALSAHGEGAARCPTCDGLGVMLGYGTPCPQCTPTPR